jgi:PPP family 3-phenylpropionic acid transporter
MRRARSPVILAYFAVFWGIGVWMPYFPLYLAHLGYRGWEIGVVSGMQPALRWGGAMLWAYAADRWRIRWKLLVLTGLGGGLCLVPLLYVREFTFMVLVLGAVALLHGAVIPMLDATVMDHLPRLGGDYGRLRLWGSASFVCGALVSAPLIQFFSPAIVPPLLLLPNVLLVPALARLPRDQSGMAGHVRAPWALLTAPLTAFLLTAFLIQASCGAWSGFFAVHTTALGFSRAVPGITWGLAVTAEIALLFWGRRIVEWIAPPRLILVVLLATAARWALTAASRNEVIVVALQLGHALTFSAFHLAALLLLARLVPRENSTSGQALYGSVAFGVGGSAGLGLAGVLIEPLGTAGVFWFEAAVALLGLPAALRLQRLAPR